MDIEELVKLTKLPKSFWMDSVPKTAYASLKEDLRVDVAIVGGGITGILSALLLGNYGLKVAILEGGHILQSTTGHTTAKITSQHGLIYNKIKSKIGTELARQYADANETAIRMIEKIAKENNIQCDFIPQSSYVYTMLDEYIEKINLETEAASSLGIKASYLEDTPLPFIVKAAVRFDDQAQFHPLKFLLPLADKISHKGTQIFENTRIVNIEEGSGYELFTDKGKKITAEKVIIASHYPFYNKHGMYFARIYPERSYVLAIKAKEKYPGGMYITAEEPGRSLRSQASETGELILVGGEHHKTGQSPNTQKHYEELIKFAGENFTVTDIPYRWSTQDCMTLDDIPYVGHFTSETPNLYVATGYGKWGMTNSMASAMLLRDLIINGDSPWKDVYSPSRKTVSASAKNFIVQNLNVAEELIEGKVSPLPDEADIKPGEGKIIEKDGQRTGLYRDDKGILHIVDTTCPHMGCELNWNPAEKSWDCPCHGSRFTYKGDVIEGPAVKPLNIFKDVNTLEKLIKDDF